jgi:molybdopterin-synthase adenylyltransferase
MNAMGNEANETRRYARQMALAEVGAGGQRRLSDAKVLIVGAGGLGSPVGLYLAAAGLGAIGVVDDDVVDIGNLQRQVVFADADVGKPKVECFRERLLHLNPGVTVAAIRERFTADNAEAMVAPWDFVVDATDNFATKFLIADVCHRAAKPYSHAGIERFVGQTMTVIPGKTCCYRCLFDGPPRVPSVPPAGPMGPVPGVIGSIQAMEAMKCVVGFGHLLTNRLLRYDALAGTCRVIPAARSASCPLCGGARP